ncbi:HAD family hydrolase [Aliivibrio sp. 1S165]|uniref:hexitol phosphatase HxpB n=1 Tax=unclassified Aliivibrio TaxID=2645654 RepID=UPI00080E82DD|nr:MULTISPECIES: hexitol phosphatase HxpB [unclassified Aliivibrio]OCH13721.1 HAD family hydrolase [Aliivibrio sp. 1S165]OCH31637.1 HAD family hydrolase [Aliivibrio sp. 1S175]
MNKKAVIFDMDGVIIDSEPFWQEAQKESLLQYGITLSTQECERLTMGKRIDEIARIWCHAYHIEIDPKVLEKNILTRLCIRISTRGQAMEGLANIIQFFKESGYQIGLATSSTHTVINAVFNRLNLWGSFDVICSAENEQFGKPHPDVYLTAARKLGISPHECIVIEDSFTGLSAAKNAEMTTYLVAANCNEVQFLSADGHYENLTTLKRFFAHELMLSNDFAVA